MKILVLSLAFFAVLYLSVLFFKAKNSKSNGYHRLLIVPLDGKTKNTELELKSSLKTDATVVAVDLGLTDEEKQIFEILKRKNNSLYLINEKEVEGLGTKYLSHIKSSH